VLAQEGELEEVLAVQWDEWDAHALGPQLPPHPPAHPDDRRVARGMPPVSPAASAAFQLAEQASHPAPLV
jgi:hypothetical protein